MMQDVTESMGLPTLKERFLGPRDQGIVYWHVPVGRPKNTRFSINYSTSVTEEMREHLKVS